MMRIKSILHPTDFSLSAQAALPVACALARDYRAKLILLHVRPLAVTAVGEFGMVLPPEPREPDEAVRTKLRHLLPADFAGLLSCQVRDGGAAAEILAAARQSQCDMIVLGTHGRSGLGRLLTGSVAETVLRTAPCAVLTIKLRAPMIAEVVDEEPMRDSEELATVCSVANPMEAEIIRNALRSEGVRCFIDGAQQAAVVGTLGIPLRIQVCVADFDRARKFMRSHEEHRKTFAHA